VKKLSDQQGFTVPELIVTIILSGLFISLVTYFGISYWRYALLQEADLDTFVTRLNAGDYLREAIGGSSGMLNQNSLADANAHVPDTSGAGAQYWAPIHAVPGTTSIGSTGTYTALMYFRRPAQNASGAFIMNGTQPYHDEYVLYMDGTTKELRVQTAPLLGIFAQ
jgi:prepilin-type N-terminal cleavage/methylation domain-containing protein